jgi:hypothetical protein
MEPARLLLTGALPMMVIAACATAFPLSLMLVWMYRRAVRAAMKSTSPRRGPGPGAGVSAAPSTAGDSEQLTVRVLDRHSSFHGTPLVAAMFRARWVAAAVYVVAGACFALVMSFGSLAADGQVSSTGRVAMLFWIYFWPTILVINLVSAIHDRARVTLVAAYFTVLALLAVALGDSSDASVGGLLLAWLILSGPATFLLAAFMIRRVRAVGPLVVASVGAAWGGAFAVLGVFQQLSDGSLRGFVAVGQQLGIGAVSFFYGSIVLGLVSFTLLGWLVLRWLARRYERYLVSDEFLQAAVIVLLFASVGSIFFALSDALWIVVGFAAFSMWWAAARLGFRVIGRARPVDRADLLLLRVFALGSRSERFLAGLQRVWLRQGRITMIAGPDLAASNIEPRGFLQFVRGRLRSQFIVDERDLEARTAAIEDRVTPDGRHRVHEFFCFDDTWRPTLNRLVQTSDVVIMDLRAFSKERKGCAWELTQLFETIPLDRVALVIDATTNQALLEEALRRSWAHTSPRSPNRQDPNGTTVTLFKCGGAAERDLRPLLASVLSRARAA